MNAKDMLDLTRDFIGEGTAKHWSDLNLMRRINLSQRLVAKIVSMSPGDWLIKKSSSLTPSSSVISLPADCSKPVYLEEVASGRALPWLTGGVKARRVSRVAGTSLDVGYREAYPIGNTIEVNEDSYGEACYLWYEQRVPDLQAGTAAAGAATSLTFPDDRNSVKIADYYNNVAIEIVSGTGAGHDTITDYTAARVATVTNTCSTDSIFGTISVLPEETHMLMILEASLLAIMKPSSTMDEKLMTYLRDERNNERKRVEEWLETRVHGSGGVVIGDMLI